MESEPLMGLAFIVPASMFLALASMACWYSWLKSADRARGLAALTIFLAAPYLSIATMAWRWGIYEADDSPAAGIPVFVALHETFWIWCGALLLLLVLHSRGEAWIHRRNEKREQPEPPE